MANVRLSTKVIYEPFILYSPQLSKGARQDNKANNNLIEE